MNKKFITPAIIIYQSNFKKITLWDLDNNNQSDESLRNYEDKLKKVLDYTWGNTHHFLQVISGGKLFTFSVHFSPEVNNAGFKKAATWEIHIWDVSGGTIIISVKLNAIDKETDVLSDEVYYKIIHACNNHINGIHVCTGCGKETKEIAGHYFAGQYCETCWKTEYRAKEARENYN